MNCKYVVLVINNLSGSTSPFYPFVFGLLRLRLGLCNHISSFLSGFPLGSAKRGVLEGEWKLAGIKETTFLLVCLLFLSMSPSCSSLPQHFQVAVGPSFHFVSVSQNQPQVAP